MTSHNEKNSLLDTRNYILESYSNCMLSQTDQSSKFKSLALPERSLSNIILNSTPALGTFKTSSIMGQQTNVNVKRKLNEHSSVHSKYRSILETKQNLSNTLLSSTGFELIKDETLWQSSSLKRKLSSLSIDTIKDNNIKGDPKQIEMIVSISDDMPKYDFPSLTSDTTVLHKFEDEENKLTALTIEEKLKEEKLKVTFLTVVSSSLLYSPKFQNCNDKFRQLILSKAEELSSEYPEFILKVALYTRQELNIRTTANFLLAYAALKTNCRPFLKRYYSASICLPTDWMEVAEIYKTLTEKGSIVLPSALRKVMVNAFTKFDKYQLAKYNRDKTKSKRTRERKKLKKSRNVGIQAKVVLDESEKDITEQSYTLKKLIRCLHISEPAEHVMCLLGKKYPSDWQSFRANNLPGDWEPEKAGKRMKLPNPETWETEVSAKGNKAAVWQSLLNQKKLPYMAMLRNIRNLIISGISMKHHDQVLKTLSSEQAVIKSRQFPLRFFSAYQVIEEMQGLLESNVQNQLRRVSFVVPRKGSMPEWKLKLRQRMLTRLSNFNKELLQRYKNAIDSAVEISTCHNIDPIQGRTLVICDLLFCQEAECPALKGSDMNKMHHGCLMLGMMMLHSCEECDLKVISNTQNWNSVDITKGTILESVFKLKNNFEDEVSANIGMCSVFYNEMFPNCLEFYLHPKVAQSIQVVLRMYKFESARCNVSLSKFDNLVLLTSEQYYETDGPNVIKDFVNKYRVLINKHLLYVEVDLTGNKNSERQESTHPDDVFVCGFSDQLLRFIAERGNKAQLNYVESIDKKYSLRHMPKPRPVISDVNTAQLSSANVKAKQWQTIRVFISSTFKDMHGERDLIVRYVIPELKARAKSLHLNIQEVDLRWGITESESDSNKSLEICLSEVSRCELFLSILGERYGMTLDYVMPDNPEFDWLKEYPPRASLTELEIYSAVLANPSSTKDNSFFYFRNKSYESQIPDEWKDHFLVENEYSHKRMENLKTRIRNCNLEIFDGYTCHWGGVINDVPVVGGLEEFGQRVLDNLWNYLCKYYKKEEIPSFSSERSFPLHSSYAMTFQQIIGQESFVQACTNDIITKDGIFLLSGKSGSGKTAVVSELCKLNNLLPTFPYFIGKDSRSFYLHNMLYDLLCCLCSYYLLQYVVPSNLQSLINILPDILEAAVEASAVRRIVIFIDGLDQIMDNSTDVLDWLPQSLPTGVKIVCSASSDSPAYVTLTERSNYTKNVHSFTLAPLGIPDRQKFICNKLEPHRKTLDTNPFNNQLFMLVSRRDAGFPLYLHLACEELKAFGQFDNLTPKLQNYPQTICLLLKEVLKQLENVHTRNVVCLALCLLSVSPEGLEEHELHTLLSVPSYMLKADKSFGEVLSIVTNIKPENIFPPMKFSVFLRTLRGFLQLNENDIGDTIRITHSDFRKAIEVYYVDFFKTNLVSIYHKLLSAYFYNDVKPLCLSQCQEVSARSFRLLLHHLFAAKCYDKLSDLFCDIEFLKASFHVGVGTEMLDCYLKLMKLFESDVMVKRTLQENNTHKKIRDYYYFASHNMHILQRYPNLVYQQAVNELIDSEVYKDSDTNKHSNIMKWLTKPKKQAQCFLTLSDFRQAIVSIAISTDGTRAALGGDDGIVRLIVVSTGKLIRNFNGHSQTVTYLCFVGNNKLCTASSDGSMSLWNVDKGHRILIFKGHTRRVSACCASICGTNIISVGWDNTIRVWSVDDGRQISSIVNIKHPLSCVTHHPTKSLIVTGGWDKKVKIWDMTTLKRKSILTGHTASVRAVAVSPNGHSIISGSFNGEIFYWSMAQGTKISHINNNTSPVNCLGFINNGSLLIAGSNDCTLKIWSYESGQVVRKEEIDKYIHCLSFLSLEYLALGYKNGLTIIVNMNTGHQQKKQNDIREPVTCLEPYFGNNPSPTGIIVGCTGGVLMLGDLDTPSYTHSINVSQTVTAAVAFQQNVIGGLENGDVFIVSLKDQEPVIVSAHQSEVTKCIIMKDNYIVTSSKDHDVRIWTLINDHQLKPYFMISHCHTDWITCCTSDDDIFITGSQDCTAKIWNIENMTNIATLVELKAQIKFVAIEGKYVLAGATDGSIGVWKKTGAFVTSFTSVPNHTCLEQIAHFSKSDEDESVHHYLLAYIDSNSILTVTKPFSKSLIATLQSHSAPVMSSSVTPEDIILSCSLDNSVKFWKLSDIDGEDSSAFTHHQGKITGVGFSPNRKIAFSTDLDGKLVVWSVNYADEQNILSYITEQKWQIGSITSSIFSKAENRYIIVCGVTEVFISLKHNETEEKHLKCQKIKHSVIALELINNSVLKELETYNVSHEVSSMAANKRNIAIGLKSGFVIITDNYLRNQNKIQMSENWIVRVALSAVNLTDVYIADTCSLKMASCNLSNPTSEIWNAFNDRPYWANALTAFNDSLYIGSDDGVLYVSSRESTSHYQIHTATVNDLSITDNYLFTCSQDRLLKVWELDTMKQIGQYHFHLPVTVISSHKLKSASSRILIICGNTIGEVNILLWVS